MTRAFAIPRAAVALLAIAAASPTCAAGAGNRLLWQIGTPDGSYREFAMAGHHPEYAARFQKEATYSVGVSRCGQMWPFIHPGPSDAWAGSRLHPFRVEFRMAAAPTSPCRLNVNLVDSRHDSPQVLQVDINGMRTFRCPVTPGAVEDSLADPAAGRQSTVSIPFQPSLLRQGRNRITLTVVNASWILYDAVSLETGSEIPSAPVLAQVSALVSPERVGVASALTVSATNIGAEGEVLLSLPGHPHTRVAAHAVPGPNTFGLPLPAGQKEAPEWVTVTAAGRVRTVPVQAPHTVWRIGRPDGDFHEFAVAGRYPEYAGRFPRDVAFTVGRSDAGRDWPFIHPGPHDPWAGGKPHPFRIAFELAHAPIGSARLSIDMVDTQPLGGPALEVDVNGRARYRLQLPKGGSDHSLGDASKGRPHKLSIPIAASLLRAGSNTIALTIVYGSWLTYDCISLETGVGLPDGPLIEGLAAVATPLFRRAGGRLRQVVRVSARNSGAAGDARVRVAGGHWRKTRISPGENTVDLLVEPFQRPMPTLVTVRSGGCDSAARFTAQPERRWKVFVGPSTHTDIGYTDFQERVYARHNENTDAALRASAAMPGFRWNLEVGYQAELYRDRGEAAHRSLLRAIREGRIGLGALYLNMLTGLCSGEELARAVTFVQELAQEAGGAALAANLTDVPTAVGTLPMLLTQSGVRYFADGANDVIPFAWGGRRMDQAPYWWEGLDGSRVLAITTRTYAQAGTVGMMDDVATMEQRLPGWLRQIGRQGYPCDAAYVYGAFSDNQPMTAKYAETAAAWNTRWEYPRIIVGRVDDFFRHVEKTAGKRLPVVRGDLGVVWEDGAASSALETAVVRRAKARLEAAERWHALAAAMSPQHRFPVGDIHRAWDQVLLFDEHTWGAADSVTNPDGEQTRHQWAVKAGFAQEAERLSAGLLASSLEAVQSVGMARRAPSPALTVFNELSWPRDIVASMPASGAEGGLRVVEVGEPSTSIACWRTADRVQFVARRVPGLGWRSYRLARGIVPSAPAILHQGGDRWSWETPDFGLRIDPATGALSSLYDKALRTEWVQSHSPYGLNQFIYVVGGGGVKTTDRSASIPAMAVSTHTYAEVEVIANGPVQAAIRITRTGEGTPPADTVLVLGPGRRIEFRNVLHKAATLGKEAGCFAFPFRLTAPGAGRAFVELPYGTMEVERDQAPGGCRDWYATNSYAAVSDGRRSATLATPHAPMLTFNDIFRGRLQEHVGSINGSVFAYVFNNSWGTNYKASQGGDMVFSFALDLRPGAFDAAAATRFGWEALSTMPDPSRGAEAGLSPAASVPSTPSSPSAAPAGRLLGLTGDAVLVGGVTRCGALLQVRLYNPSGSRSLAVVSLPGRRLGDAWVADLTGKPKARLPVATGGASVRATVPARGTVTLLLGPGPP
jgi:hypothetical protein